ncbi:Hypothetical protein FKW44_012896 [Caligus rogercresseyi]|uniref:Uncharacterized protein n=1 Tax=Caligus rogercresseyi TaxID=217165 RepID=A0A7T8HK06_CALRO|nr:Hypothetical protein FKW44_012896 [Caligus rogercresseyi]
MNKEFISLVMGRYNDKTRKKENMLELLPTPLYKRSEGSKIFTITLLFIISGAHRNRRELDSRAC